MSDVKVKGLSELTAFLKELPDKVQNNILRGAVRAGLAPVRNEARQNVQKKTGQLAAGLKTGSKKEGDTVVGTLKATGKHGYIATWIEHGTAAHEIIAAAGGALFINGEHYVTEVHHPGTHAKPFLRPALETKAQDAVVAVGNYIKGRLTKEGINGAAEVNIEPEDSAS